MSLISTIKKYLTSESEELRTYQIDNTIHPLTIEECQLITPIREVWRLKSTSFGRAKSIRQELVGREISKLLSDIKRIESLYGKAIIVKFKNVIKAFEPNSENSVLLNLTYRISKEFNITQDQALKLPCLEYKVLDGLELGEILASEGTALKNYVVSLIISQKYAGFTIISNAPSGEQLLTLRDRDVKSIEQSFKNYGFMRDAPLKVVSRPVTSTKVDTSLQFTLTDMYSWIEKATAGVLGVDVNLLSFASNSTYQNKQYAIISLFTNTLQSELNILNDDLEELTGENWGLNFDDINLSLNKGKK